MTPQPSMPSDLYERVGQQVSVLRKSHRWTQEDLAERANLTTSYVARIEAGKRRPTLDALSAIADALGEPVQRLLGADETPSTSSYAGLLADLVRIARTLPRADLHLLIEVALRFSKAATGSSRTARNEEPDST